MSLSFRWTRGVGVVAAAVLGALAPAVAEAGLAYVEADRSVRAEATDGSPGGELNTDGTTGFDPFGGDVSARFLDPGDEDLQTARATQNSELGETSINASGILETFSEDEQANAGTRVHATFDLDQAADFVLSLEANYSFKRLGADRGAIRLQRLASDGGVAEVIAEDVVTGEELDGQAEPFTLSFSESGRLEPSRYLLEFDLEASGTVTGRENLDYTLSFTTSDVDTGGGETPIPLPPAAWAGLLTFACYGASRALGRRSRRD